MSLVPPPSPCAPDGVIHLKTQSVPDCAQVRHQDAETHSPCQRACWFVYPDRLICRCLQPRICLLQVFAGAGTPHGGEHCHLGRVRHRVPLCG